MNIIFYSCEKSPVTTSLFNHHVFINEPITLDNIHRITSENTLCIGYNDNLRDAELINALRSKNICNIITRSKGIDHINVLCCSTLDIKVYSIDYDISSVAEYVMFLTLSLLKKSKNIFTCDSYSSYISDMIQDKSVGIIGYGKIGEKIESLMNPFHPKEILIHSKHNSNSFSLDYVLTRADIIFISCSLNRDTSNLINESKFNLLKPSCVMVNIARGNVINHTALINHIQTHPEFYYASDVIENENGMLYEMIKSKSDSVVNFLYTHPNVIITPHTAFLTKQTIDDMSNRIKNRQLIPQN